jgi:hypothetical protein
MAEVEFAGTTFRGGKMFAVLTALSTLGGGAYGGFEVYKDYMDMKEIIQNIDIGAIETANALQIQKLDDAIGYTVDIKDDLKADVQALEERTARDIARMMNLLSTLESSVAESQDTVRTLRSDVLDKLDAFESRLRVTQGSIDTTLDGIRTEMNDNTKSVTESIREVEGTIRASEKDVRSTMRETETRLIADMNILEAELKEILQEALDNPLNN